MSRTGPCTIFAALAIFAAPFLAHAAAPQAGQQYYTAYNFMAEKNKHVTTNYWRGEFIPINTPVTLKAIKGKKIVLTMDGREITLVNSDKHTQRSSETIAGELLSPTPVSIGGKFADDIKAGVLRLGMTKDQVIQTRGHPPRHKTPSTDGSRWIYWSSRFVTQTLVFENGKLTQGRGLH